jgi:OmpA family
MKFLLQILVLLYLWAIGLQLNAHSHKTSSATDVFFEHNESQKMTAPSIAKLRDLIYRTTQSDLQVVIAVGHAKHDEKDQLLLSKKRAEAVKRKLVEFGIRDEIIYTEGKAALQPAGSDPKLNARVEIETVGSMRGWATKSWNDVQSQSLTWRTLNLSVRPKTGYQTDEVPASWQSSDRNKLPVLAFIQSIEDPVWREIFAHKLLIEAIWRKDDALTKKAHEERAIAHAILGKNKQHSRLDSYPNAGLEAASYGTAYAKELTRAELERLTKFDDSKQIQLQQLACDHPVYGKRDDDYFISGAQSLFGKQSFMDNLMPTIQLRILQCLQIDFSYKQAFAWALTQGANPDVTNEKGQTFLHTDIATWAAQHIRDLIKANANPNAQDYQGNTPLHIVNVARREGYGGTLAPTIELNQSEKQQLWDTLIAAGANPNIPNKAGQLPVRP